ncbi:MAG TPA: hypothetical protein DDZ83_11775 [Nitrospinae bacterium]|nr:hypothetical protein [Nitrospinota bacterium]
MSEAVKVDPQTSPGLEGLVPIDLEILQGGEPLKFPIYQRLNGSRSFALVMNRRQRFTERLRAAIRTSEGLKVYTKRRFLSDYEDYLESRMGNFLSDESVPLETRSGVLYGQASKVVEGLFTGDISPKSLEKAANEASHLSMYLSLHPKALRSMMSLTSNDYYTFTHSLHVCIYGLGLYQQVFPRKSAASMDLVSVGLLFHDIGKCRVDGAILKKDGPLNPSEWETIKRHPAWGRDILVENGNQDPTILDIVLAHHERMDGRGYPNGLKGDELTDAAKIAAIADVFDAMTTNRPYKKRLTRFEALKEMGDQNRYGDHFAHHFFEAFVRMMGD